MTDLSPMERAVRSLDHATGSGAAVMGALARLRTSDPAAFAAVLAECGVDTEREAWVGGLHFFATETAGVFNVDGMGLGLHLVSEGQAVIEGRVVELEPEVITVPKPCGDPEDCWPHGMHDVTIYRVKPERSDRHAEDAS